METFVGRVWVLGGDIDTDIIIPTEYLTSKMIEDMRQYGSSPPRPELTGWIEEGDITVVGENFGYGSSREQASEIVKVLGIRCVIVKLHARTFFQNPTNNGLLLIEQPDLHDVVSKGDEIMVEVNHFVKHQREECLIVLLSEDLVDVIGAGGLVRAMCKLNDLD